MCAKWLVDVGWSELAHDTNPKLVQRRVTGYLKLLFPDSNPTPAEFREYCVRPAVELRQRVRDELHKLDDEYASVSIEIAT